MAREENSLLFSLKELHKLEADRLQEEEDLRVADIEAKRQAQENAERAVRDAEEARIQAQKDAEKRAREEKERKEMEDRIHLEQAERQARIAAQEKIELNRLAAEAEAIRTKPINWKLIGAVASAVLMVSIVIVGAVKSNREKTAKQEIAALDAKLDAERKADRAETARLQSVLRERMAEVAKLNDTLNSAKNEQERMDFARKARAAAASAAAASAEAAAQARAAKEREKKARFEKCKNSNDPLCGIN